MSPRARTNAGSTRHWIGSKEPSVGYGGFTMFDRNMRRSALLAALGIGLTASAAVGQFKLPKKHRSKPPARTTDLEDFRDEADKVLAPITGGMSPQEAADSAGFWSIVIVAFTGDTQAEAATLGLVKARTEGGLPGAYLEKRDKATVIAYGRYESPDDPRAQDDLEMIRSMKTEGTRPFASALLTPPAPKHLAGSLPELDLRNAKKLFGKDKALYTLQVAIYGRGDRARASSEDIAASRKAAEDAAVILRRDGELAFYYHAAERSMVTVGIFGQDDYDPLNRPGIESPALLRAREQHPLNLLNGQGIRERIPGAKGNSPENYRLQSSSLVSVPE